jgi:hypothetical protein
MGIAAFYHHDAAVRTFLGKFEAVVSVISIIYCAAYLGLSRRDHSQTDWVA